MAQITATTSSQVMLPATNRSYEAIFMQIFGGSNAYIDFAESTSTTTGLLAYDWADGTGMMVRRPPFTPVSVVSDGTNDVRFQVYA